MNKQTTKAVEALAKHIITERLIPRVTELLKTPSDQDSHYKSLLAYYYEMLTANNCYLLAEKSLIGLHSNMKYLNPTDLEDLVCNVITSSLQPEDNDYKRVKKSTYGFWGDRFELERSAFSFEITFSYVLYKAVQSEARNLVTRAKHEVQMLVGSDDDMWKLDSYADENDVQEKAELMSGFEDSLVQMKDRVLGLKSMDEINRLIFLKWFEQKDKTNFSQYVNMLRLVFEPAQKELSENGIQITTSAMHYRWKKIQEEIRTVIRDLAKSEKVVSFF